MTKRIGKTLYSDTQYGPCYDEIRQKRMADCPKCNLIIEASVYNFKRHLELFHPEDVRHKP